MTAASCTASAMAGWIDSRAGRCRPLAGTECRACRPRSTPTGTCKVDTYQAYAAVMAELGRPRPTRGVTSQTAAGNPNSPGRGRSSRRTGRRSPALAFAHVDVDVDPVGLALIGGVVLAQVQRGGVVVAVATVLGIADTGGEAAGYLDLVIGDVGDLRVVVYARAALVTVVRARRVLLQGRVVEVAHRRLRRVRSRPAACGAVAPAADWASTVPGRARHSSRVRGGS